jgi:hypothetical protein
MALGACVVFGVAVYSVRGGHLLGSRAPTETPLVSVREIRWIEGSGEQRLSITVHNDRHYPLRAEIRCELAGRTGTRCPTQETPVIASNSDMTLPLRVTPPPRSGDAVVLEFREVLESVGTDFVQSATKTLVNVP